MELTIEIKPQINQGIDGEWRVAVIQGGTRKERTYPDVTYALEGLEEAISLALEVAYPGVEDVYR